MISNYNIICFGFAEWDNPYRTNQHHLMERLSSKNRVLFIESLGLRRPTAQAKDLARIFRRLLKWLRGVKKVSDTLFVFSPLVLPFHKYALVRALNRFLLAAQLDRIVSRYGFTRPVIWSYVPNAVEFLGRWGERLIVYHCVDELSANPMIPGKVIAKLEEEYIRKADLTFVTSKPLFEAKKKFSSNVYYLPNVADYAHFSLAASSGTVLSVEMTAITRPVLGFVGAVSGYKIDMELLAYLAGGHPEWSIVLIGETGEGEKAADLSLLSGRANVHILGGRAYKSLPSYIKGFDICLLPSRLNDYTKNMFPMKFFEYLASGKPVVSTALEALADFRELAYFSKNKEEFEHNIILALRENDSALIEKRIAAAKAFTWENRVEEMSGLIEGATR